ncbi:hypothetical protein [Microbacterium sp. NPDC058345]|uniref:hypothetical protein n=1 Tax=Microbacterium sp. NPDC058345 TaxID=3346455 RepID=UPI003648218C
MQGPGAVDTGAASLAGGPASLTDDGRVQSYTVQSGDAPAAIGERFCIDYITVLQFNNIETTVQPGDVLTLLVDPAVEFTRVP